MLICKARSTIPVSPDQGGRGGGVTDLIRPRVAGTHTYWVHLVNDSSFFLCFLQQNKPSQLLSPPLSPSPAEGSESKECEGVLIGNRPILILNSQTPSYLLQSNERDSGLCRPHPLPPPPVLRGLQKTLRVPLKCCLI